jgi:hypothetical protein
LHRLEEKLFTAECGRDKPAEVAEKSFCRTDGEVGKEMLYVLLCVLCG